MSDYTKSLTQTVATLAIHDALGVKLISQTSSPQPTAHLEFIATPLHFASNQNVHGGISSLLIDGACYLALIPSLSQGEGAMTIASSFQIMGAVAGEGKKYEIDARVVKRGKTIAFCEGEVSCEGIIIARGTLTKMITSPKEIKRESSKL